MNQREVLVGGKIGCTGACLTSLCPLPPAPGPPQAPSYSERFCGNIGPADSKGHSSCVTLVTLVLSPVFKAGSSPAPANLAFRRPQDSGVLSWHVGRCVGWDVCGFWELKASCLFHILEDPDFTLLFVMLDREALSSSLGLPWGGGFLRLAVGTRSWD